MPALPPPMPERLSVLEAPRPLSPAELEQQRTAEKARQEAEEKAAALAEARRRGPRSVTIPAGTMITVRLQETLTSATKEKDTSFNVSLDAPLIVNGLAIAERGSLHKGRIVELNRAGRAASRARMGLELTELTLSDGQVIEVKTDPFRHEGESAERGSTLRRTATWAAIAASIGAMASGGKGAAIGAGIGAASGAGSVVLTKNPEAVLASETRITFRLREPVTVTEKIP